MTFHCSPSLSGKNSFLLGEISKDTIKGCHFCFKSSNFGEILQCVFEPGNNHSRNAIKVLSTKGETIGHVPEWLKYLIQKWIKKRCSHWKLKLLDHQEMPLKENGCSVEEWKYHVHIKCVEESTKKVIYVKN